jgi:pimeloyl-ACP methyl ester carboxylesterase
LFQKLRDNMEIGRTQADAHGEAVIRTLAEFAADDYGKSDARPPLVLLHGLTFDRSLWRPSLRELQRIDPGRRVLALDLPGHGESPRWPAYDVESVTHGVHRAVEEAQLHSPVVVGHSIAGVIATVYAAHYPTRGVINVDQPLQVEPFAGLVQSLADKLRGPAFPAVWQMFAASMHIERLPAAGQELVRSSSQPRQDLVLGYWREVLYRPASELADMVGATLAAVRAAGVPYLLVAGDELTTGYRGWLIERLPHATVMEWPGSGHFPHIAHPSRFAACLAAAGLEGSNAAIIASAVKAP